MPIGNVTFSCKVFTKVKYLDDAEELARKYKLKEAKFERLDTAVMNFDSRYDLISSVLLLHEVDPLCLPYVLRNMLRTLKNDGTLVISDFEGPYEQEKGVVAWNVGDIKCILEKIGGANISIEFTPASEFPDELGFYRCYVKKPKFDRLGFDYFMKEYADFLKEYR